MFCVFSDQCGEGNKVEVFGFATALDAADGFGLSPFISCYQYDIHFNISSMEECAACESFNQTLPNPSVFFYSAKERKCIKYLCYGWNLGQSVEDTSNDDLAVTVLLPGKFIAVSI